MKLNYFLTSLSVIFASIFFVINDAIINYLSSQNIMFYHFIFYGIPAYLSVPIYFLFTGKLKNHLKCSNYSIPLIRGLFFAPLPFITFVALLLSVPIIILSGYIKSLIASPSRRNSGFEIISIFLYFFLIIFSILSPVVTGTVDLFTIILYLLIYLDISLLALNTYFKFTKFVFLLVGENNV